MVGRQEKLLKTVMLKNCEIAKFTETLILTKTTLIIFMMAEEILYYKIYSDLTVLSNIHSNILHARQNFGTVTLMFYD